MYDRTTVSSLWNLSLILHLFIFFFYLWEILSPLSSNPWTGYFIPAIIFLTSMSSSYSLNVLLKIASYFWFMDSVCFYILLRILWCKYFLFCPLHYLCSQRVPSVWMVFCPPWRFMGIGPLCLLMGLIVGQLGNCRPASTFTGARQLSLQLLSPGAVHCLSWAISSCRLFRAEQARKSLYQLTVQCVDFYLILRTPFIIFIPPSTAWCRCGDLSVYVWLITQIFSWIPCF